MKRKSVWILLSLFVLSVAWAVFILSRMFFVGQQLEVFFQGTKYGFQRLEIISGVSLVTLVHREISSGESSYSSHNGVLSTWSMGGTTSIRRPEVRELARNIRSTPWYDASGSGEMTLALLNGTLLKGAQGGGLEESVTPLRSWVPTSEGYEFRGRILNLHFFAQVDTLRGNLTYKIRKK